ncbi:UBC-like protein [Meredithblackwellia eburnea MCA 4105]
MSRSVNPASQHTARQEVLIELSALGNPSHCPLGMYVLPDKEDVFKWHGVLFVHKGYYASAVFHFTVLIPTSYPSSAPQVFFPSTIFHPLIDPTNGKFHLNSRFPTWRPRVDFIFHVLHFVKASFKRASLDQVREASCANKEAYRLYRDQTPLFTKLASQSALLSITDTALYSASSSVGGKTKPSLSTRTREDERQQRGIKFRKLEEGEEDKLWNEVETQERSKLVAKGLH